MGTAAAPHGRAPPWPGWWEGTPWASCGRPWAPRGGQGQRDTGRGPPHSFPALLGRSVAVLWPLAAPICAAVNAAAFGVPAPARAESTRAPTPAPCREEKFLLFWRCPNRTPRPAPPSWGRGLDADRRTRPARRSALGKISRTRGAIRSLAPALQTFFGWGDGRAPTGPPAHVWPRMAAPPRPSVPAHT